MTRNLYGIQTQHAQVPNVKRVSVTARNTIQAYLNLVDWRHIQEGDPQGDAKDWSTSLEFIQWQEQQDAKAIPSQEVGKLIRGLIYEPSNPILLEELEEIKGLLKEGTPISWLQRRNSDEGSRGPGATGKRGATTDRYQVSSVD